ncbi:hypothetical protein SDC9_107505 [bioreactor metagenome]|uniref:Uncharacterized protein n=1 Tax=bioreactor metagenome TaxID=1076179 RepID=A0A645BBU5_9ZZZZ
MAGSERIRGYVLDAVFYQHKGAGAGENVYHCQRHGLYDSDGGDDRARRCLRFAAEDLALRRRLPDGAQAKHRHGRNGCLFNLDVCPVRHGGLRELCHLH